MKIIMKSLTLQHSFAQRMKKRRQKKHTHTREKKMMHFLCAMVNVYMLVGRRRQRRWWNKLRQVHDFLVPSFFTLFCQLWIVCDKFNQHLTRMQKKKRTGVQCCWFYIFHYIKSEMTNRHSGGRCEECMHAMCIIFDYIAYISVIAWQKPHHVHDSVELCVCSAYGNVYIFNQTCEENTNGQRVHILCYHGSCFLSLSLTHTQMRLQMPLPSQSLSSLIDRRHISPHQP